MDADGNEIFLEKDPASGAWHEVRPVGMAQMGRPQAELLANDMAKNTAGWLSSDDVDFARWGGREAFVYDVTQRLMQGESPEAIMGQKAGGESTSVKSEAEYRAFLKANGRTADEIESRVNAAYRKGLLTGVAGEADKSVDKDGAVELAPEGSRGMALFSKPEPGMALGPRAVDAVGEAVAPIGEAVRGVKERSALNVLRTRLPVIQAAIRRGNMTKAELAEAVKAIDLLPKGLRDKVKRLMAG